MPQRVLWELNDRTTTELYIGLNMNANYCGTKEKVTNYWSTWNKAIINDMSDLNNSEIASRPHKHFNELIAHWQPVGISLNICPQGILNVNNIVMGFLSIIQKGWKCKNCWRQIWTLLAHLDTLGKFGHFWQISSFWAILNNNLTNSLFLCQIFGNDSDQFSLGLEAKLISDDLVLKSTLCVFESLQVIVYHVAPTVHICQCH